MLGSLGHSLMTDGAAPLEWLRHGLGGSGGSLLRVQESPGGFWGFEAVQGLRGWALGFLVFLLRAFFRLLGTSSGIRTAEGMGFGVWGLGFGPLGFVPHDLGQLRLGLEDGAGLQLLPEFILIKLL